jgi:hypothetical protein
MAAKGNCSRKAGATQRSCVAYDVVISAVRSRKFERILAQELPNPHRILQRSRALGVLDIRE